MGDGAGPGAVELARSAASRGDWQQSYDLLVEADANGGACCRELVTRSHARHVGALPRLDGHIEMAGRVGDLAEHR